MKERKIVTPEVTDVTDSVATVGTFAFSYLKNTADKIAKSIASGLKDAKADAQQAQEERVIGRILKEEVEKMYQTELSTRIETLRNLNPDALK